MKQAVGRLAFVAEMNRLLVEHSGRKPYHRPVLTDFVHWYPLADAARHAPTSSGVFQVKVNGRLLEYPSGKSAMVCYGSAENLRETVSEVAQRHHEEDFLCRHQSSSVPAVLLDFVLHQFVRRFGTTPAWPQEPTDPGTIK